MLASNYGGWKQQIYFLFADHPEPHLASNNQFPARRLHAGRPTVRSRALGNSCTPPTVQSTRPHPLPEEFDTLKALSL